jgi:hypothetical protein
VSAREPRPPLDDDMRRLGMRCQIIRNSKSMKIFDFVRVAQIRSADYVNFESGQGVLTVKQQMKVIQALGYETLEEFLAVDLSKLPPCKKQRRMHLEEVQELAPASTETTNVTQSQKNQAGTGENQARPWAIVYTGSSSTGKNRGRG